MSRPTYESFVVPLRVTPLAVIMPVDSRKVFGELRSKLPGYISNLMTLPTSCHVWVHEHHIHKILGLTSSKTHGQYHALSCVLTTIKNGKGGNKNKNTYLAVDPKYACCSFAPLSSNTHQIAFSEHGSLETHC